MLTRKETIAVVLGGALVAVVWLVFELRKEEGFLWMSARRFTQIAVVLAIPPAMERFRADVGRFPTTEEGLNALIHAPTTDKEKWRGPYIDWPEVSRDVWGHAYRYRSPAIKSKVGFDVWSLGEDGIPSDDDIGNWKS